MHPDTDELLFALEGSVTIELFEHAGNQRVPLDAGSVVVVPRGPLHRHVDAAHLIELDHTAGQSLGCQDPSTVSENDAE